MELPKLSSVKQLSPSITRVLGLNPSDFTLQGTNTYLIGAPSSSSRVLVDCGEGKPSYSKLLREHLNANNLEIGAILITHWHPDHLAGAPQVVKDLSLKVPIYKFPDEHDHGYDLQFTHVHDNQILKLCGVDIHLLHTPGHAEDHLVLWVDNDKVMLSADNVLGHGTTSYENYRKYMSSLERMLKVPNLGRIFPGHGEAIEDGPAKIREYISHRLERENQVLQVIQDNGPISSQDITLKVYQGVPPTVQIAAKRGVDQFLEKLEAEQKIRRQGNEFARI